jgi:transcriptional regulator with XRE-family HTH domain
MRNKVIETLEKVEKVLKQISVDLDKLIALRKEHDLSISHVSASIGYKTPTGYWLIEKGERKVSVQILFHLAGLYGVTMESLLKIEE